MNYEAFKDKTREAVLAALDEVAYNFENVDKDSGWRDEDLPLLFRAIDAHSKAVFERITESV